MFHMKCFNFVMRQNSKCNGPKWVQGSPTLTNKSCSQSKGAKRSVFGRTGHFEFLRSQDSLLGAATVPCLDPAECS